MNLYEHTGFYRRLFSCVQTLLSAGIEGEKHCVVSHCDQEVKFLLAQ